MFISIRKKRKIQQPNHLVQFLLSTTVGNESEAIDVETTPVENHFRINMYFKLLYSIIANLKKNDYYTKTCL